MLSSIDFLTAPIKQGTENIGIGILTNNSFRRCNCEGKECGNLLDVSVYKLVKENNTFFFCEARECEKDTDIHVKAYFVVNNEHEIIYSTKLCKEFCYVRLALDTIVLWLDKKNYFLWTNVLKGENSRGIAIINNKLTENSYIGCIGEYGFFKNEDKYHLYCIQNGLYPDSIEETLMNNSDEIWEIAGHSFHYIQEIETDVIYFWRGVYPDNDKEYIYVIAVSKKYRALFIHRFNSVYDPYSGYEKRIIEFPYQDILCQENKIQLFANQNTLIIHSPWSKQMDSELIIQLTMDENGELQYRKL